jgi:hypothetical protein
MPDQEDTDASGSTAQFRAFVNRSQGGGEATQAWSMNAPRNQVVKLVAIAVAVAAVLAILAFLIIG